MDDGSSFDRLLDRIEARDEFRAAFRCVTAERDRYRAALEKIADPRKRDHREPDAYTQLGCVMHIAETALSEGGPK